MILEQMSITTEDKGIELIRENLSTANKAVYDAFVITFASSLMTCVINYEGFIDSARFTDQVVSEDTLEFDYTLLSVQDKDIINVFNELINTLWKISQ